MSELLNSLNVPESPAKSWASEVAEAAASEPAAVAAEAPAPEPAPTEPEPQEAAPEPSEAHDEAPETQDRRVPLKALQEERQKRAEYERQVQEFQRREQEWRQWAEQVQRQQMMGHNGGPQMEQEAAPPDPETDPIGALKYEREQRQRMLETLQQQQQAAQQQQYVQQLNQVAYQAATQFQQQAPDYQDAYRYALNSRAQELVALGTPETQVQAILQREELSLIDTALRNGRNPAEAIYHFAKARGFNGKPAAQPAPTANPMLQQAKAAVAPSATSGGAPAAKGTISDADMANLKGAAFDAAWNKRFGGNKNSLFRD